MSGKLWDNYNATKAYDGYFTNENKLRKHAVIISNILERYGKDKLQEIEKNCQSTISARGINFRVYAANNRAEEKKWPLDIIPRIIPTFFFSQHLNNPGTPMTESLLKALGSKKLSSNLLYMQSTFKGPLTVFI